MSNRTQMRLQQLTGSLSSVQAATEVLNAPSLQEVMDHLASGITRITGAPAYHAQDAGHFSQNILIDGDLTATGSLQVDVDANIDGGVVVGQGLVVLADGMMVTGSAFFANNLSVVGDADAQNMVVRTEATLASAIVQDVTATHVMFAGTGGAVEGAAGLVWDGADLVAASAKVSDLTDGRVVYAGASGALVDSSEMTFGAGGLTLAKDLSARSGSFSGDLSVEGDLQVKGALTYIDTQNLLVADAKIVISSGSLVDGAGIYLGDEAAGENIRWATADGGKWIASDKLAADTLQALDLSSALVWADAAGNLAEVSAADFGGYLAAGFGIDSVANGQIDATPYVAGTGVTITNFTASIGQSVATTDSVTFAAVTGSNLTALRLMASNADKGMVSADLFAWVAGTANQVSVADDADGSITLSLPQDIHTGASPEFLALNLAAYGDLVADGSNLKIAAAAELLLSGADGQYQFAEAGDRAAFAARYGASETVIGAINALGNAAGLTNKFSFDVASAIVADTDVTFTGLDVSALGNTDDKKNKRLDVYVNGQLLRLGASYDYIFGTGVDQIKFKFALQADDIATVVVR